MAEKRLIYSKTTFFIESRPSEGHAITTQLDNKLFIKNGPNQTKACY